MKLFFGHAGKNQGSVTASFYVCQGKDQNADYANHV
jgi:hypothetical protein